MTDSDKQALLDGRATIPYRITILGDTEEDNVILTETDIVNTSYEDYRYVDTATICIGQFVARTISGELVNKNDAFTVENKEIKVEFAVKTNAGTNYYSLGNFLITAPTDDDVKDKTTFEAMDYTKKFNQEFDGSGLTFPCTALQLAQYCCDKCGVELATTTFVNSTFIVPNNQYETGDTYRKVMQDIGKLAYSWVRIGWDNKCYIDFDVPTTVKDDYSKISTSNYYDLSLQKEVFGPVNRVVIGMTDVEGENAYIEDEDSIAVNGVCELQIMDCNITYTPELRQQAIQGASRLFGLTYLPLEINTTGHPWLLGKELIEITTTEGTKVTTIPFDRTIEYMGHIKTKLTSKADTKTETEYKNPGTLETSVRQTRIIVDKQNQTITQLVTNVDEYDERITRVEQDVDSISQQVSQISDLTREVTNNGSVTLEDAYQGNLLELRIYGDVCPFFPRTNVYPSSTLFLKPSKYYLTVEYQENGETKQTVISLPFDYLLINGDVYDEFVVETNGSCYKIKRLELLADGSVSELEEEQIITYDNMIIPIYEGNNKYYLNYYTPTFYAKYAKQSDLTDVFATKVEVNSSITQTRDEIELSVTQEITDATDTDTLISKINLSPGQIKLEGTVTANENFKILQDGSIEAVNGSFSGDIFLDDGKKVIGGDGLFTNLQYSTTGEYWGWSLLGFTYRYVANGGVIDYVDLILDCDIPENFTVDTAYIILDTTAINGTYYDGDASGDVTGYPKQLKLYKGSNYSTFSLYYQYGSDYWYDGSSLSLTEIENAFGDKSYTPEESYAGGIDTIRTVDISNEIEVGTRNQFVVRTAMNKPSNTQNAISNTGIGRMTLNIFGYMSNEEVE
jgi:hypothetical protein